MSGGTDALRAPGALGVAGPESVTVVVPTFNESGNVRELLRRLGAALPVRHPCRAVFVDDSTDDTAAVIEEAAPGCPYPVTVVRRAVPEGGLGGAVVEGMRAADSDWIVVMDADLQHPPDLVPELVDAGVREGADLVVASRYCPGGSRAGLAGGYRVAVSRGATWLAKALFPRALRGVSDPMSGFFAVRRETVAGAITAGGAAGAGGAGGATDGVRGATGAVGDMRGATGTAGWASTPGAGDSTGGVHGAAGAIGTASAPGAGGGTGGVHGAAGAGAADGAGLQPLGYKILLELVVRCRPAAVTEVPFAFQERFAGESKSTAREGFRFLRHLAALRTASPFARMLAFGLIGLTGFLPNLLGLTLLTGTGLHYLPAEIVANQFGVVWNFALIELLLFQHRRAHRHWADRLARVALLANADLVLRIPLIAVFVGGLGLGVLPATALALLVTFVLRYAATEALVYVPRTRLARSRGGRHRRPRRDT
ncbi:glycosyltransferase [Streptomyces cinnamoneus]|uniref:Dolichol-phosphate mannosyltransferase n=1 Tax=Streptomyces cinnamoneus TaxID=53446 RepID=A0A918WKM1_STRCJ|nr:glycosyltransferase [Streptomyces cinnamoneus]GHC51522.1 hypothetical protein GCM10010507_29340 [Streptomyces cinnamoneus]